VRGLLLIIAFVSLSCAAIGQPFGNEWIDYISNQRYLKFEVAHSGIYRIDRSTLNFALQQTSPATNLNSIDPRSIQVFAFGSEQRIHIEGQNDGSFDSGDFIELYCRSNDGSLEAAFYPSENDQTNPYYSLYSDTVTYFITWLTDGSFSTQRYNTIPYTGAAVSPMPYMLIERLQNFTTQYNDGENIGAGVTNALYHGGKGWVSKIFGYNGNSEPTLAATKFTTKNAFTGIGAPNISVEIGVVGMNQGAGGPDAHHVRFRRNNGGGFVQFSEVYLESYAYKRHTAQITIGVLPADQLQVDAYTNATGAGNETSSDYSALSFVKCTFPHELDVSGEDLSTLAFISPQSSTQFHFNLSNWGADATTYLYDPDLGRRYECTQSGTTLKTNLEAGTRRQLIVQKESDVVQLGSSDLVTAGNAGKFADVQSIQKDSAFLLVHHKDLLSSANAYATYRNSTTGGRVVQVDIQELYDQFAYGIPFHPASIRGLCDYAIQNWNVPPKHLFLLGKSIQESKHRKSATARAEILVPTMGSPPSDNLLTMGLSNHPYAAAIATGRIAATNNTQVNTYLNKLIEAENAQNSIVAEYTIGKKLWQKHVLHFAGGNNSEENDQFRGCLNSYKNSIEGPNFGGKVFLFSKTSGSVIEQLDLDTIRDLISDGVDHDLFRTRHHNWI